MDSCGGRSREQYLERVSRVVCRPRLAFGLLHAADDLSRVVLRIGIVEFHIHAADDLSCDVVGLGLGVFAFGLLHAADDLSFDVVGLGVFAFSLLHAADDLSCFIHSFGIVGRADFVFAGGFSGFSNRRTGFEPARGEHPDGLSLGVVSEFAGFGHGIYQHGIGALSRGDFADIGDRSTVV